MSRQGKLVKNTMILSIGTFLPKLAILVTLPILTSCLTKEEYGSYDLVITLVALLLPSATLQIQSAAFRFLIGIRMEGNDAQTEFEKKKGIVSNLYAFVLPVSSIALMVLFFILRDTDLVTRLLICGYFLVDIISNSARQIARGLERNLDYSISAIISALFKLIFVVIFVLWLGIGLRGAVLSLLLASTCAMTILVLRIKLYKYIDPKLVSWKVIKKLLAYSWPMVPNSMAMWVMTLSDRLVLTGFLGLAANAVYAIANKIPNLMTLAQTTFSMAWQENASIVSKDKDASAYYSMMFRRLFDLMAGVMGLLICMTPVLFKLLIRGDYGEAYNHIPILFLAMFFFGQSTFLGGIYVAYLDTKSVGITTIIAAVCNLTIDLALVNTIGIYAASLSTLVSFLLLYVFRMINVRKHVKLEYKISHLLIVLGILIVECVLCFLQKPVFNIINIVLGIVVYFVLNRSFNKTIINKIKGIFKRLLKNKG